MNLDDIKAHWSAWAREFESDIRATTRTPTIKKLEIAAIGRFIEEACAGKDAANVLEVGCGNGVNCLALAAELDSMHFDGVDYIPEMIDSAKASLAESELQNLRFEVGNILELGSNPFLAPTYDVVFTNRCVINLNQHALQMDALTQLSHRVKPGGLLLLLENQICTHAAQNELREALRLPARKAADFNLFMDQTKTLQHMQSLGFEHSSSSNFASLHDLMLYVLLPAISEGKTVYDHPLMDAVTELLLNRPDLSESFGAFGQNQLLVFRRCQR